MTDAHRRWRAAGRWTIAVGAALAVFFVLWWAWYELRWPPVGTGPQPDFGGKAVNEDHGNYGSARDEYGNWPARELEDEYYRLLYSSRLPPVNFHLPDQFEPVMHPGDWRHHGLGVRLGNYKGDFTPEKAPEVF
jgi:hypothetical protein